MKIVEEVTSARVDLSAVVLLETKLKISLHSQYKAFIIKYNGGRPSPSKFVYLDESGPYCDSKVDWFLAIYNGEYDSFESYYNVHKVKYNNLPGALIPIAHDPGGNLICISSEKTDYGYIYFWDHEDDDSQAFTTTEYPSSIHVISHSFDEFVDSLH